MRFSRIGWGVIACAVAVVAVLVVQTLETRVLGAPNRGSLWVTFLGAGGAILWLADRFGLMVSPYAESTLGLRAQDGPTPHSLHLTSLEAFLKAEDLDDLLRVRRGISSPTSEESSRIVAVIDEWTDRQAVANLLFYPDLIPADLRFEALDRALHSHDVPYFALAATVGLQQIVLDDVPADKRARWVQALLRLVQSQSRALAGRASVTLYSWMRGVTTPDLLPELLSLYPVTDEGASRNIVAAGLARCGNLPPDEFDQRLTDWRVPDAARTALRSAYEEYLRLKAHDAFRAKLMLSPSLAYIPNLSESTKPDFL